jgi:CBS domain-containing protein
MALGRCPASIGGSAMKRLRDIMRYGFLFTVDRHATVAEAVRIMTKNNVGIVSVLDGDQLVGVFSERDVVRRVVDRGFDPVRTPVDQVMTADLVVADADEDYQSAIHKMDQANIRHLPVVSGGQLLSMLSIRDLLRVNMEDKDAEIHHLHAYLFQVPPSFASAPDEP